MNISSIISMIFYKVFYMSIIGSVGILFIIIINKIFNNKISPRLKFIMWIPVLISLILPFKYTINLDLGISTNANIINEYKSSDKTDLIKDNSQIFYEYNLMNYEETKVKNQEDKIVNYQDKIKLDYIIIKYILPGVWLIGMFVYLFLLIIESNVINKMIGKEVVNDSRLEKILENCKKTLGINKEIKIILQDFKRVPCIYGYLSPKILITQDLLNKNNETINYIFLHELSHYKRRDYITNKLLLLIIMLHWFNPIIWKVFKIIRQDMELATDENVLNILNENQKNKYGLALLKLLEISQETRLKFKVLCVIDTNKNMEGRIKMIKSYKKNRSKRTLSIMIVLISIILTSGIVFANYENNNQKSINEVGELENNVSKNTINNKDESQENTVLNSEIAEEKIQENEIKEDNKHLDTKKDVKKEENNMKNENIIDNDSTEIIKNSNIETTKSGEFIFPIKGSTVSSAIISSKYGESVNPVTGQSTFHNGIDIPKLSGTEIVAVADGKVIKVGNDEIEGNTLVIQHSNNIQTKYAQCNSINVKEGDTVNQGDIIATVGSTGKATGPHLHFEVIVNGNNVNPLNYFK